MKKLFTLTVLMVLVIGGYAQEVHFDFSITNSTGYEIYYRIIDEESHWVEATYPCQNGENYWWGFDRPEGKLILPETVNHNGIDFTLVAIGDHAFCDCTGLRGLLELPQTINTIGEAAFKGCSNLSGDLTIPNIVAHIDNEAFADCSRLSGKLHLSDSLQSIGASAFKNCSNLTGELSIPNKVTEIGESCFEQCSGFDDMLRLPASVSFISANAFKGCSKLKYINTKIHNPSAADATAFEGVHTWISVWVPYQTQDDYRNTAAWSRFGEKIVEKSIWNGKAEAWTHGTGTEEDPYLIASAENLAWLAKSVNERFDLQYDIYTWYSPGGAYIVDTVYYANNVNAYQDTCFKLVIDIDLQQQYDQTWAPIGLPHVSEYNDYTTYFSGHFDGAGHTIANYYHKLAWNAVPSSIGIGLFGMISDALIQNLTTSGAKLTSYQQNSYCGGIVGFGFNSTIANCHTLSGELYNGTLDYAKNASLGGIIGEAHSCRLEGCTNHIHLKGNNSYSGGIAGTFRCSKDYHPEEGVYNCSNTGAVNCQMDYTKAGGIVGYCTSDSITTGTTRIVHCYSKGSLNGLTISGGGFGSPVQPHNNYIGGIVGYVDSIDTLNIMNCYSNDSIVTQTAGNNHVGGILGSSNETVTLNIKNCYHVGAILASYSGGIICNNTDMTVIRNCYFDESVADDDGFGIPLDSDYMKTAAFINQLNNGSTVFMMDHEPYANDGYPIFGTDGLIFVGAEWYYEIHNDDGSITYQHLECVGDTLINREGKRPKVIVRSNTHYNRDTITEVTHEYVYEENGVVYWWNKTLGKFTVLYDFSAEVGDEWTIEVGDETITTHVYDFDLQYIDGIPYKKLTIADPNNAFSGSLLSSIGHMTSFFPERLMNRGKAFRVEGLRCYWVDDELVYKTGNDDCDAIYTELHNGIEEPTDDASFAVYPNPTNGILFVETRLIASLPDPTEYRITNLTGQTLLQGSINIENQQIDINNLPAGMYFINFDGQTVKFVVK